MIGTWRIVFCKWLQHATSTLLPIKTSGWDLISGEELPRKQAEWYPSTWPSEAKSMSPAE